MPANKLFFGDNLDVLRKHVPDQGVDLIYLDPPFNSQASYNVLFRSPAGEQSRAQIEAFDDTWHWNESAERAFDDVMTGGNSDAAEILRAMRSFLRENDMMAYLAMMAVRLVESLRCIPRRLRRLSLPEGQYPAPWGGDPLFLHRVLKPTGSLYLHCDPTASHYLKLLLDATFGPERFVNEIVWKRYGAHNDSRTYGRVHDIIFFYSKSDKKEIFETT